MILIGGLGNPGQQYELTRHNVGFMVVDKLATELGWSWKSQADLQSDVAKGPEALLFKPQTFVNLSGQAAEAVVKFYKESAENIWIIQDEAELPLGKVNIKFGGTSAGHNGIKSIDETVGVSYWRIRVGIGKDSGRDLADHVLDKFTTDEKLKLAVVIDQTVTYLIQSLKDKQLQSQTLIING